MTEPTTDAPREPSRLEALFSRIVDLLPWRQESDLRDAKDAIATDFAELVDNVKASVGRNATPAGVVKPDAPNEPDRADASQESTVFGGNDPGVTPVTVKDSE